MADDSSRSRRGDGPPKVNVFSGNGIQNVGGRMFVGGEVTIGGVRQRRPQDGMWNMGASGFQSNTAGGTDLNDDSDSSATSSNHSSSPPPSTRTGSSNNTNVSTATRTGFVSADNSSLRIVPRSSISSNSGARNVSRITPQQSSDASRTATEEGRSRSHSPRRTSSTAGYRDRPDHPAGNRRRFDIHPGTPSGQSARLQRIQRSRANPSPGSGTDPSPSNDIHITGPVRISGGASRGRVVTVGPGITFHNVDEAELGRLRLPLVGDNTAQGSTAATQDSDEGSDTANRE